MSTSKRIAKRLIAVVLTVMMLMSMVTIGMTSASAAYVDMAETGANVSNGTVIYFDNSTFGWTNSCIQLMIGHGSWSQGYQMTKLNGTDLYYVTMPQWDGATQLCVFGTDSVWGGEGSSISNRKNWAPNSTPVYSLGSNISGTHLLTTTSSALSKTTLSAYSALNTTQTISALVNGEAVTDVATFTASSYNLTSKTASAASSGTTTVSAARTADVTMTAAANEGYTFLGWSTDGTSVTSADATYTYTCDGTAKTVYAMFEEEAVAETTTAPASSSVATGDEPATEPTTTTPGTSDPEEPNGTAFELDWAESSGLYAYAGATDDAIDAEAWQRWLSKSEGRVFYLPASASKTEVIIYNSYTNTVTVNGVKIDAGCYNTVPYVAGTTYTITDAENQKLTIYNTDAEASLFINTDEAKASVVDDDSDGTETALADYSGHWYDFLVGNTKNREVKKLGGAVASDDGIVVEQVKKIKGRGNSTWKQETKKPFNITFAEAVGVDGMLAGEKWSLLANAKDDSLLRNRLVYDMANEVGMKYACDSRLVDFFVDGRYMGSYQLVQKIEMGEGTVMEDLTEVKTDPTNAKYKASGFDFILELDTEENAASANDNGDITAINQWMTFKTPDEPTEEQAAWMMAKYQAVEDALYGGDLATLAELVDIDDFAKAYLINEVAKNVDAGITSCYFVYNSTEDKFYLSPVWDYDNAVGNMGGDTRESVNGGMLDLATTFDWYAKDLKHYNSSLKSSNSIFAQAYRMDGTTAEGDTFDDIVKRVWAADFADIDDILKGDVDGTGRLKSTAEYLNIVKKSGQWNYETSWKASNGWTLKQNWTSDHSSLTMFDYDADTNTYTSEVKSYNASNAQDMNQYVNDWLVARINWIDAQYNEAEEVVPEGSKAVYVGVITYLTYTPTLHYWNNTTGLAGDATLTATGETEQFAVGSEYWSNAKQTFNIYKGYIPAEATGMKTWDGNSTWAAEEVTYAEDQIILLFEYSGTHHNFTAEYVVEEPTTAPAETTTAPAESSSAATTDETTPAETTTAPTAETMTIYFENNWNWPDAKIYYWFADDTNNKWPGESMTYVDKQSDGYSRYSIEVPTDIAGIIFSGTGEFGFEQCADITEGWYDGICYYMTYDSATDTKPAGSYTYEPIVEESSSTPVESTPATADETDPVESTPAATTDETTPAETTTAPEAETMTIYFENNWNWPDAKIYYWFADDTDNKWPGESMTYVDKQSDGYSRYSIEVPTDIAGIIFSGTGEFGFEQCADITEGWYDGICYYMTYDSETNTKPAGSYTYEPIVEESSSTPVESTPAATADETDPVESTPAATTDETEPSIPDMPTVITVYAINSAKWDEVYAYAWATDPAVAWPGVAMDKTEDTVNGFDVYALSFDSAYVNVIFNNNNKGAQTADLTAKDGQYYDIKGAAWYASLEDVPALDTLSTDRYIVGEFNGWSTTANEFKLKAEGESYGYVTLTLEANTTYEFKVIREGAWTSCTTPVTGTVAGLQFSSSNADNCTITTTDAGEYVFAFGLDDSKLNVTYPGSEVITPTTPDEEETDTTVKLAGDFTEWGTNAIEMTADENGTVYTTELYLEANTYEFKMIEFGKWLGNNGSIENTCEGWTFRNGTDENGNEYGNCTLVATGGTYTFTFDTTTDKLTITAVLDEIPATVYDVNWPVDNGLYTVNAPATADEGSVIEFTVDAVEGYTVAGVIVNMEEVYADENGVYTWTVTENVNIMAVVIDGSITPDEPTEYNVYAPESEYYTVNAPATVEANGTLTFTIDVVDDYVIDYVIVNMVEVYANDANEYVFEDVTEDVEILVYVSEDTSNDTPIVTPEKYTVMFVDYDNTILAVAKVEAGTNLPAPEAPTRAGYTFTGWSQATDNVVKDMIVVAQYKKIEVPVEPATIGRLQVEVSGGTGVTVNGRPQGTSYLNTKMTIGTSVTLVAKASSDATFVGWLNASNNLIITTDTTYTFTATGNDSYKALYLNDVEGVNVVRFMNDKSKQILDMQYYAAGETIVYPEYPTQAGFQATGWNMTDAQIQAQLEAGNDVTVSPTWERVKVYVNVSANGGTLSNGNGSYLLTGYVTATANAPETGMKFAYWVDQDNNVKSYDAEYSFFAVKDTELTAVYVAEDEEIEYKILVNVDAIDTVTYDTTNATYYSWYVPTTQMGIKYVKNGVISVNKKNYNEATFVAGSTDSNVYDRGPSGTEAVPVGSRSWTKSNVAVGDTWMSRAYVQYTIDGDPTGTVYTVYSDIVEATRY